jgi:hypothetical protein
VPAPKNAASPEFFVYRLEVQGVPFYVGVGRAARASDRVRYVRSLMDREDRGELVKWKLSPRVVADLLRLGYEITVAYPATGLERPQAVKQERAEIARLLGKGLIIANIHHNPLRPKSAEVVVKAVQARLPGGARWHGA